MNVVDYKAKLNDAIQQIGIDLEHEFSGLFFQFNPDKNGVMLLKITRYGPENIYFEMSLDETYSEANKMSVINSLYGVLLLVIDEVLQLEDLRHVDVEDYLIH